MRYKAIFIFLMLGAAPLSAAAPPYNNSRYYESENSAAIKEIKNALDNMRHGINNHEIEMRAFEERLSTLDSMIETVRDQAGEVQRAHKEQMKGSSQDLETKIAALETNSKGIMGDLKQLKTHANDSAAVLAQMVQKFSELEKVIDRQNQDIDSLQTAMHSLVEAFGGGKTLGAGKESGSKDAGKKNPSPPENSYRVKPGDNLEKIARAHQTSIRALKELNHLPEEDDKIVVGKILLIPPKGK
jgi:LysM repeat protein/archaellum component FlaC